MASLDDPSSAEQLRNLLNVPSAETRYDAFALWTMDPNDPMIHGQQLGGQFSYHVLDIPGSPMIHVTRNRRAEIVLFGRQQQFTTPLAINAGNQIMVTSISDDEISVSKFTTHDADEKRTVSTHVDDVIRAIVELGGSYPDVVQALHEAKAAGALSSRFEVDTLPEAGIPYERVAKGSGDDKTFHPNSGESSEQNKSEATAKTPPRRLAAMRLAPIRRPPTRAILTRIRNLSGRSLIEWWEGPPTEDWGLSRFSRAADIALDTDVLAAKLGPFLRAMGPADRQRLPHPCSRHSNSSVSRALPTEPGLSSPPASRSSSARTARASRTSWTRSSGCWASRASRASAAGRWPT